MIQLDDWKRDVDMIEKFWLRSETILAIHPNHDRALKRDISRLVMITRQLDQYIRETIGGHAKATKELQLAKKAITSKCTCGRRDKDPLCPVHRSRLEEDL